MTETVSFAKEIDQNKNAAEVSNIVAGIETDASSLDVRLRGAYITGCELTSPQTGNRIAVLYSDKKTTVPKLTATHAMIPAGPYEGIGGQHGFPRWADYHEFPLDDGPNGEKRLAVQAKRSDEGLSLTKQFELSDSTLISRTTVASWENITEHTSIGEHLYFSLERGNINGLQVDGQSLNELLGKGSEDILVNGGTLVYGFGGEATITFPAGHSIKLSASFEGHTKYPPIMWIWKRQDSPSICFEPVVGVEHLGEGDRAGVTIEPHSSGTLTTKIELL